MLIKKLQSKVNLLNLANLLWPWQKWTRQKNIIDCLKLFIVSQNLTLLSLVRKSLNFIAYQCFTPMPETNVKLKYTVANLATNAASKNIHPLHET